MVDKPHLRFLLRPTSIFIVMRICRYSRGEVGEGGQVDCISHSHLHAMLFHETPIQVPLFVSYMKVKYMLLLLLYTIV